MSLAADEYVVITQNNVNVIVVSARKNSTREYDSPIGRNLPEVLVKDNSLFCVYPKYLSSNAKQGSQISIEISKGSEHDIKIAKMLMKASELWRSDDREFKTKAIELYKEVRAHYADYNHKLVELSLVNLAAAQFHTFQLELALSTIQEIEQLALLDPDVDFQINFLKGEALLRQGKAKAAITALELAYQKIKDLDDDNVERTNNLVELLNLLGDAYLVDRNIEEGENRIRKALALVDKDAEILAKIHDNLAYVYLEKAKLVKKSERKSFWVKALSEEHLALSFSNDANDLEQMIIIHNNIASIYSRMWKLRSAQRHYLIAMLLMEGKQDHKRRALVYRNLGYNYYLLGHHKAALQYLERAIEYTDKASPIWSAKLRCYLASTKRYLSQQQASIDGHQSCYKILEQHNAQNKDKALAIIELIRDFEHFGIRNSKLKYYESLEDLTLDLKNEDILSAAYIELAKHNNSLGHLELANKMLALGLDYAERGVNPVLKIDSFVAGLEMAIKREDLALAISYGKKAIASTEKIFSEIDTAEIGPSWSNKMHRLYRTMTDILLASAYQTNDEKKIADAFHILERSRAISLRLRLSEQHNRVSNQSKIEEFSLIANDAANTSNLKSLPLDYYLVKDLSSLPSGVAATDLSDREIQQFKNGLTLSETSTIPRPLNIEQIQQKLTSNQLALNYYVSEQNIFVFTITLESIAVKKLDSVEAVKPLLVELQAAIKSDFLSVDRNLVKLSNYLFSDIFKSFKGNEIILVGHDFLHQVPFSALTDNLVSHRYIPLISKYSITLSPSLSIYYMKKKSKGTVYSKPLVVLANPNFGISSLKKQSKKLNINERDYRSWSSSLRDLPWTKNEALDIETIVGKKSIKKFLGLDANRKVFTSKSVRDAQVLHIATHGFFNSLLPENVGFALSEVKIAGRSYSGFVTLAELFSYSFNNELVVISGCETAMGKQSNGEGMLGLSRAFLAQGSKNVIATMWPVSDEASATFMPLFYQHLKTTKKPATALRLAQNDMREIDDYYHPFYWAAYNLYSVNESNIEFNQKPN